MDKYTIANLEAQIDAHGLAAVVSALADIALEKAEHIRTNWQDDALASRWDRAGLDLQAAYSKIEQYIP